MNMRDASTRIERHLHYCAREVKAYLARCWHLIYSKSSALYDKIEPGWAHAEVHTPTARMTTIYIKCDPEFFEGRTEIPVTLPKKKINMKRKMPVVPRVAITLGEQVDEALKEWYGARGQPVPADEIGIGVKIDAAEAAEAKRQEAAWAKEAEQLPAEAPAYGTPEFWAYHRAKKAAENKRREAEGLPPLPTKKELEAEKAKKKAEREAAKAAKEAAKKAKKA